MNTKEDIERLRSEAEERRSNAIYELHQLHDDISTKADQVDGLIVSVRESLGAGEIDITKMMSALKEARRTLEDIQNDVGQASREANTAETFVAVPVKPATDYSVDGTFSEPPAEPKTATVKIDEDGYATSVTMSTADEVAMDMDGGPIWEDGPDYHAWKTGYDDGFWGRTRYPLPPNFNRKAYVGGYKRGKAESDRWDEAVNGKTGGPPEPSHTEPVGSVSEHARQEAAAWRRGYEDGLLNRAPYYTRSHLMYSKDEKRVYERGYKDGARAFALNRETTIEGA